MEALEGATADAGFDEALEVGHAGALMAIETPTRCWVEAHVTDELPRRFASCRDAGTQEPDHGAGRIGRVPRDRQAILADLRKIPIDDDVEELLARGRDLIERRLRTAETLRDVVGRQMKKALAEEQRREVFEEARRAARGAIA